MSVDPLATATLTLDHLVDEVWVYQLKDGHRFSTDDVVCGWWAARAHPTARRLLDLGSGVGSVGLVAWSLLSRERSDVHLTGVEAQEVSHALAQRSVARAGLEDRVRMIHADLRSLDEVLGDERFDLITGSPPYFPPGTAIASPHPQRAACRMELRGSVVDYCWAAASRLAEGGRFVFVMPARDRRVEEGPVQAGLEVLDRWDVVFRRGAPPMLAVLTCAQAGSTATKRGPTRTLVIREADGRVSDDYERIKAELGFGGRPG